jgi:hypothetical protein
LRAPAASCKHKCQVASRIQKSQAACRRPRLHKFQVARASPQLLAEAASCTGCTQNLQVAGRVYKLCRVRSSHVASNCIRCLLSRRRLNLQAAQVARIPCTRKSFASCEWNLQDAQVSPIALRGYKLHRLRPEATSFTDCAFKLQVGGTSTESNRDSARFRLKRQVAHRSAKCNQVQPSSMPKLQVVSAKPWLRRNSARFQLNLASQGGRQLRQHPQAKADSACPLEPVSQSDIPGWAQGCGGFYSLRVLRSVTSPTLSHNSVQCRGVIGMLCVPDVPSHAISLTLSLNSVLL